MKAAAIAIGASAAVVGFAAGFALFYGQWQLARPLIARGANVAAPIALRQQIATLDPTIRGLVEALGVETVGAVIGAALETALMQNLP